MIVLGIQPMGESAAAIVVDGQVVAAVEEERLSRRKHEGRFPLASVASCLEMAGLRMGDVDEIAIAWQPWRLRRRLAHVAETVVRDPARARSKLERMVEVARAAGAPASNERSEGSWLDAARASLLLRERFGPLRARVRHLDHHATHAALSFFGSPFDRAAILILDGGGEEASTTLAVGEGRALRVVDRVPWPNSLGHFYSALTGYLGFQMLDGEYKMMGLAPYGKPTLAESMEREILHVDDGGHYTLRRDVIDYHDALKGRFTDAARKLLGPPRAPDDPWTDHHAVIAASAQAVFEHAVLALARRLRRETGCENLVLGGGCALNATANGRMLREAGFARVWVPPAAHDAGCAIGAAFLATSKTMRPAPVEHAALGPDITDAGAVQALRAAGLEPPPRSEEHALVDEVADRLAQGAVVAFAHGRAEFGPRALGHRSFLADPRDDKVREVLNAKIKKRELFRPFAPSVLASAANRYFELDQPAPFMNITAPTRAERRREIPAVVHVDGSARIQTVEPRTSPRYAALLQAFGERTGHPVLLNTSFNINEPIVTTAEQALATFLRSGVDLLVLGDRIIQRAG